MTAGPFAGLCSGVQPSPRHPVSRCSPPELPLASTSRVVSRRNWARRHFRRARAVRNRPRLDDAAAGCSARKSAVRRIRSLFGRTAALAVFPVAVPPGNSRRRDVWAWIRDRDPQSCRARSLFRCCRGHWARASASRGAATSSIRGEARREQPWSTGVPSKHSDEVPALSARSVRFGRGGPRGAAPRRARTGGGHQLRVRGRETRKPVQEITRRAPLPSTARRRKPRSGCRSIMRQATRRPGFAAHERQSEVGRVS